MPVRSSNRWRQMAKEKCNMAILDQTSTGTAVNFGKTATDYAQFRAGFPDEFFGQLKIRGYAQESFRILDLGTGTGTIARGLAKLGCEVVGLDPSTELVEQARILDRAAGLKINYVIGKAENIPSPANYFDLVTAGQCWHWFEADLAAKEIFRVLKKGANLIIAYFDWVPRDSNVVDLSLRLIERHNPLWTRNTHPGFFRQTAPEVPIPLNFKGEETISFELPIIYSQEGWRGRIRASAAVGASMMPEQVVEFDEAHAKLLRESFPETLSIPHRVWTKVLSAQMGFLRGS